MKCDNCKKLNSQLPDYEAIFYPLEFKDLIEVKLPKMLFVELANAEKEIILAKSFFERFSGIIDLNNKSTYQLITVIYFLSENHFYVDLKDPYLWQKGKME